MSVVAFVWLRIQAEPFVGWKRLGKMLRHPSSILDVQLLLGRQLLRFLFIAPTMATAWWVATHLVRRADGAWGVPDAPGLSQIEILTLYSLCLFVLGDLSRFVLHWIVHRVPVLWRFHQVHHSAEVLTPLTFHRIHPLESLLYDLRGALVTGTVAGLFYWFFRDRAEVWAYLGVPVIGFGLNLVTGNLRHSPLWLRYPSWLEYWLISPAQHQLHHSADPTQHHANYGTWLAIWDRMMGSLHLAEAPPARFGIDPATRNHGNDLISAWLGPFRPSKAIGTLALTGLIMLPARAEEPDSEEEAVEEEEVVTDDRMVIYAPDGTPRVAGSAHYMDESSLQRFEMDNIERIVAQLPGVSTRTEDGFGLRPNMGIRGANSDRSAKLTLMEDGVLLAPAPYAAPAAYYFPMSSRMVGLEVFKGPAAAVHGPHTVGGALNLLTRNVPIGPGHATDLAIGLRRALKAHAWAGQGGDRVGVLVEGLHLQTDGFKELDGGGDTGFGRSEFMLKSFLRPGVDQELELKLGYAHERSHETYLGLTLDDYQGNPYRRYAASSEGLMEWNRTQAELSWRQQINDGLLLRSVAYHHYLDRSWTKLNGFASGVDTHNLLQTAPTTGMGAVYLAILRGDEDSTTDDQQLRIGTNARTFHSYGLQNSARWEARSGELSSRMDLGLRLHADDVARLHTESLHDMSNGQLVDAGEDLITTTDSQASARALAAYIQEDLGYRELHLIPSARLEVVQTALEDAGETAEDAVTRMNLLPGLGVLGPLGDWVDAFAGLHRGYSPVAPGQSEDILPELSWNYEAGLRLNQGSRHAELVGFFNDYQNLTGQCSMSGGCGADDVDRQFNGGDVWIYGTEIVLGEEILLPAELSLRMDLSYAWTRSSFQTAFVSAFPQFDVVQMGDSLPYVAEHQGSLVLSLSHPRFKLNTGLSGHSGMLDSAGTWPITELDIPPLLLVDAAGSFSLGERLELYLSGTNLGGSTAISSWRPVGARPVAPRQIMLGLQTRRPTTSL
jgi:Fe(3+) dicitrate transport protein